MSLIILVTILGVIALSAAALFAKLASSKVMILAGLALVLFASWSYVVLALGVLSAHEFPETVEKWPTPMLLASVGLCYFGAVATVSFVRKQD